MRGGNWVIDSKWSKLRRERKTDERLTEVAGTMVAARDCLEEEKGEALGSSSGGIPTFTSVYLMVLAQKEIEAEMQVKIPTSSPRSRKRSTLKHVQEF